MKAFENCDQRVNSLCLKYHHECQPGMETGIGYPKGCWRMREESEKLLQCPVCRKPLWYDKYKNILGFDDIFYCNDCDTEVSRALAVQTKSRLIEAIKEKSEIVEELECCRTPLSQRAYDLLTSTRHRIMRLRQMMDDLS